MLLSVVAVAVLAAGSSSARGDEAKDFIDDANLDRYQGRRTFTKLLQGLGHHVVKAGLDFEEMSYQHKKAYTGHVRFAAN